MMGRAFFGSFAMRLFSAGAGFVIAVILGRLLGAAGFGSFTLAMGWLGVTTIFTTLGFQHFTVRAIPPLVAEGRLHAVAGLIIFAASLTGSLALLAMLLAPIVIKRLQLFPDPAMEAAVLAVGLYFLPVTINQLRQGVLRGLGQPLGAQLPELILQPTIFVALIGAATALGWRLDTIRAIELMLLSVVICLCVGIWFLARSLKGNLLWPPAFFPLSWLLQAGKSCYLFAAVTVMSATDILMLGHLSNAEETGVYGVAARFYLLMFLPSLATSSSLSHEISRLYRGEQKAELEATVRRSATYAAFLAVLLALVCTIATFRLGPIFGAEFEVAALPILILVWSRAAEALLGQPGVILANTAFVGLTGGGVTFAIALNFALNALLIPKFGATGAAIATATAHLIMASIFAALTLWKAKIVSLPSIRMQFF